MVTSTDRRKYIQVGALNLIILAGGFAGNLLQNSRVWLALACAAIGISTFWGLLWIAGDTNMSERHMRSAATGAIIVVYLTIVSIYAFFRPGEGMPPNQLTDMLMTSFTTVIGVVIASYFGASAYLEGRKSEQEREQKSTNESPKQ